MPCLRRARQLARFALAWMALSLGVAVASPWVKPPSMQLLCSAAGAVTWVMLDGDGAVVSGAGALDCPLCIGPVAPPLAPLGGVASVVAPVSAPAWVRADAAIAPVGHGWLARAPPAQS